MDRQLKLSDSAIIDLLGGTSKVAKMCKVATTAVTQWRKHGIPADRFMFLGARIEQESHGLVSRKDLFPTNYFLIWPELLKNNAFGLQQEDLD